MVSTHALVQITNFFSATPRGLVYVGPSQCSETGETETSSSGSTQKIWGVRFVVQLSPCSGRNWELEFVCPPAHSLLGQGRSCGKCLQASFNHCMFSVPSGDWHTPGPVSALRQVT